MEHTLQEAIEKARQTGGKVFVIQGDDLSSANFFRLTADGEQIVDDREERAKAIQVLIRSNPMCPNVCFSFDIRPSDYDSHALKCNKCGYEGSDYKFYIYQAPPDRQRRRQRESELTTALTH